MQARFRKSSGGQYFSATRILTVVDVVTVPAESGQTQPEGVNLSCDSCISRENKTANGATTHELDILCFEAWRGDPEKVAIVTAALAELYKHGKLATTFTTRTAGNKQVMRCCGLRWSGQGTDGEHVGLHVFRKVVAIAEEACAALVMPKAVEAIERPVLGGYLLDLITSTLQCGGNLCSAKFPYIIYSLTRNYFNDPHYDKGDNKDSIIFWLDDLSAGGRVSGGAFGCCKHSVHTLPMHGSLMYLRTSVVQHFSITPKCAKGAGRLGVGLASQNKFNHKALWRLDQSL